MPKGRRIREIAAHLALLALFVRLIVGFGHIHSSEIFGPAADSSSDAGFSQSHLIGATEIAHPTSPSPGSDQGIPADACEICAAMALADVLVLTDAVAVPPPGDLGAASIPMAEAFLLVSISFPLFRTRAPPVPEIA